MSVLVAGATGATGRLLVEELLKRGILVKAVVRTPAKLPGSISRHPNLTVIQGEIHRMTDDELAAHVSDCRAVASCLGHNLSFKGMFGPPHRLVAGSVRRLCAAVVANRPDTPVRFVLMNTTGNTNRDLKESYPLIDRVILNTLRVLLPPHADNIAAAETLRTRIGQDHPAVEWCAVRPDSLVDQPVGTPYDLHPSPTHGVLINAGQTSRVNVAHFMASLITDDRLWREWRGRMPVIYNRPPEQGGSS